MVFFAHILLFGVYLMVILFLFVPPTDSEADYLTCESSLSSIILYHACAANTNEAESVSAPVHGVLSEKMQAEKTGSDY